MTVEGLPKLSLRGKLQVMEAIWDGLRGHIDVMDVPEEHHRILDDRRARVESGESVVLPWDRVKHSFGQA